jgi:hypothetical protein
MRRKRKKRSQINILTLQLKKLDKKEVVKPKASRNKDIVRIKAEIKKILNKKMIKKVNKTVLQND